MNKYKECECCAASYEGYKIGKDSEVYGYHCTAPLNFKPTENAKGLCAFCNPKSSVWYNHKESHSRESCRINVNTTP